MLFKKRDSGLVEELNNSVVAMDSQVVEIWNNIAGFEFSVWKNPAKYDKKQREEIQVSLDKARNEVRDFVRAEILFKDVVIAIEDLKDEDANPETSEISDGELMDMFDDLENSYRKVYARYLTIQTTYQTFVREHKLPELELIKESQTC